MRQSTPSADERAVYDEAYDTAAVAMRVAEMFYDSRTACGLTQTEVAKRMRTTQPPGTRVAVAGPQLDENGTSFVVTALNAGTDRVCRAEAGTSPHVSAAVTAVTNEAPVFRARMLVAPCPTIGRATLGRASFRDHAAPQAVLRTNAERPGWLRPGRSVSALIAGTRC